MSASFAFPIAPRSPAHPTASVKFTGVKLGNMPCSSPKFGASIIHSIVFPDIVAPFGGRVADRRRRSSLILIFGLAQFPIYIIYGLANSILIVVIFFIIHGVVYSMMQPAVDAHVAASTTVGARARIQGLYSAAGLVGGFVGASGCSFLYGLNFRLPLFAIGVGFGICVLIGGTLVRVYESRNNVTPKVDAGNAQQKIIAATGETK